VNFTESNNFPATSGAIVTITDNEGNSDKLVETEPGKYTSASLTGKPGSTYTLDILFEGEHFIGSSTMPEPVYFDAIEFSKINNFGGSKNVPVPVYSDPEHAGNYYRFIEEVNGKRIDAVFVRDDKVTNGRIVRQPLFDFSDKSTDKGDTVQIEMMCIDEIVYDYFFSLSQIAGGSGPNQTGTPANPLSNISGGALGYFSAHTVQIKEAIVP
jgi:hypothetical protein